MPGRGGLQGYDATIALFKKYQGDAGGRADAAVRQVAHKIKDRAVELCPKETGALRESARVLRGDRPTQWIVSFGSSGTTKFGGFRDTFYAVYVHEIPKAHYTTPGTGAKYLSRAVDEMVPVIMEEFPKMFAGTQFGAFSFTGEYLPPE